MSVLLLWVMLLREAAWLFTKGVWLCREVVWLLREMAWVAREVFWLMKWTVGRVLVEMLLNFFWVLTCLSFSNFLFSHLRTLISDFKVLIVSW